MENNHQLPPSPSPQPTTITLTGATKKNAQSQNASTENVPDPVIKNPTISSKHKNNPSACTVVPAIVLRCGAAAVMGCGVAGGGCVRLEHCDVSVVVRDTLMGCQKKRAPHGLTPFPTTPNLKHQISQLPSYPCFNHSQSLTTHVCASLFRTDLKQLVMKSMMPRDMFCVHRQLVSGCARTTNKTDIHKYKHMMSTSLATHTT